MAGVAEQRKVSLLVPDGQQFNGSGDDAYNCTKWQSAELANFLTPVTIGASFRSGCK